MSKRRGYKGQTNLGKALINNTVRKRKSATASRAGLHTVEYGGNKQEAPAVTSVLERDALEELIATASLARANYEAERRPDLVQIAAATSMKQKAPITVPFLENELAVRVLRRPSWTSDMSAEELTAAEDTAFLSWRRELAVLEEQRGLLLSPYEKNVDFWRQLWRTVERSDVVVQIVDARDPLFYFCDDLFSYVDEVATLQGRKKRKILLFNKADYVPFNVRNMWRSYFQDKGLELYFFSALDELQRCKTKDESTNSSDSDVESSETSDSDSEATSYTTSSVESLKRAPMVAHPASINDAQVGREVGDDLLDVDALVTVFEGDSNEPIVVGCTGFPNVGKSTLINALVGSKKVSMSRQPGKTKHIQTLILNSTLTLCDCPGLVLPSVVVSKAHLVINGTVPLDHIRDPLPSVELVVSRMGVEALLAHYACEKFYLPEFKKIGSARGLLCAYAVSRKLFLRLHLPDESKAARVILKDFCRGAIVHAMLPPVVDSKLDSIEEEEGEDSDYEEVEDEELFSDAESFDDVTNEHKMDPEERRLALEDMNAFLLESRQNETKTKRAARMALKEEVKAGRRFAGEKGGVGKQFINTQLIVKPGQKAGRVGTSSLDPYGCHRKDEFFI